MAIILQESEGVEPRGRIEFDEYERNHYVSRFLEIFNTGLSESEMCEQCWQLHLQLRSQHDLYIAVYDRLEWKHKNALKIYAACKGELP